MIGKRLLLCLLTALVFTACSSANLEKPTAPAESGQVSPADQSAFTWKISVFGSEIKEALHTTGTVTQYDGTVEEITFENKPAPGNVFVLINLTVNKAAAGGPAFSWKDVVLTDGAGTSYARYENDVFLSDHGYDRMAGTDLRLGENSGWVCFELPADQAKTALILTHTSEEGVNSVPVS